ncbi:MAG TPA: MaoC/PaaZ C-terminal domain-containing protein [Marmoricola sp.]
MSTERVIHATPSALPTMLKAALPALPGVNLIPGIRKSGGALPDLRLTRPGIRLDRDHVAAYAKVCGFAPSETLPLTYPHMLGFPLHMAIMTDGSFPYPAIGTVHLRNAITQHRPIAPSEVLDATAIATNRRPHAKGTAFDLVTTVTTGDETVWESTSTYLRLGRGDTDAAVEGVPLDVVASTGIKWRLPGDLGRRYAAVSGDHNPIHLYPLTAKAFGFPRQIAHGMWSKARCVAALANRLPGEVTVEVEFKKPILLPGTVAFGSRVVDDGAHQGFDFSLTNPRTSAPHLVGRTR